MTASAPNHRPVYVWLFITAAAVLLMALIGAVTRLTESGLSIVEWKPVSGALPPLTEADWAHEFALYQQSPQYKKVNLGMTLAEFKQIFFWEWVHRQWGRLIGLIYAVPLVYFWLSGRIPAAAKKYALGILCLGALQGFMGWFMVKSGLVDAPAVSHYRLAAHLSLAAIIYACLLRLAFFVRAVPLQHNAHVMTPLRGFVRATLAAVGVTLVWGAFVAGLDAGLVYNTFPMMDAHWFPPETMQTVPVWSAFFAEPATVQFTHRVLAMLVLLKILTLFMRARSLVLPPRLNRLLAAVCGMAVLQVSLGISTLISHVNIHLATLHQGGAFILIGLLVWMLHEIPAKTKESA